MNVPNISFEKPLPASVNATDQKVEDLCRLRILPEAPGRRNEEPGPDEPDGIDRLRGAARDIFAGRTVSPVNAKLDQILQASALAQADALIGREITSADGKTSGTVTEVKLKADGIVAVLAGGKEIPITPGVVIRPADGMNEADALDIVQYAIWTVLTAAGPAVAVAMLVGIGIALVQALTQIQEITLDLRAEDRGDPAGRRFHRTFHRRPDLRLHQRHLRAHRDRFLALNSERRSRLASSSHKLG